MILVTPCRRLTILYFGGTAMDGNNFNETIYVPTDDEEFMNDRQLSFFKSKLIEWKDSIMEGNRSTIEDMQGGTFTITNGGPFVSILSTPIINPPQSAILGMHNIVERPVAIEGKVEVRPIMYLALSYDHRIIDGKSSVGFLCKVKECLEDPKLHLMDNKIEKSLEL